MPLQWRFQVMETQLKELTGHSVQLLETDLFGLTGADRDAAVQALLAGKAMPFALINGVLACDGVLEVGRIAEAMQRGSDL